MLRYGEGLGKGKVVVHVPGREEKGFTCRPMKKGINK